jgi:hypothetical protein
MGSAIPSISAVRLAADTREQIAAYAAANALTHSQAVRILLAIALDSESARSPDVAFRAAAAREGVVRGIAVFKRRLQEATALALADLSSKQ